MNAREQLRRFLEQRREMGESELVLDGMDVEQVMQILGAPRGVAESVRVSAVAPPPEPPPFGAGPDRAPERGPGADARDAVLGDAGATDWRAALKAAGAGAPGSAPKPASMTALPATPAAATPTSPPSEAAAAGDVEREGATPAPIGGGRLGFVPPEEVAAPAADAGVGLVVGDAGPVGGEFAHLATLGDVAAMVGGCTRCSLYSTALNPVPGEGNPDADFMVVGEAPGASEDESGRPFVGAAGQLLTKILGAIKLGREDVFIANVLKHRPPGNRNPLPEEVAACSPYLLRQIELVRPKVILALGTFAAQTLLGTKLPISKLRGQVHRFHGVPLIVTYHPAALLRNPAWKRPTWEDVQLARRVLDRAVGGA
ncbi:MAG TPA: uracil-DNA glycosylase [Gemmatimonadaceae bacterium]